VLVVIFKNYCFAGCWCCTTKHKAQTSTNKKRNHLSKQRQIRISYSIPYITYYLEMRCVIGRCLSCMRKYSKRLAKLGFNTTKQFLIMALIFMLIQYVAVIEPFNRRIGRHMRHLRLIRLQSGHESADLWAGERQRNPALELDQVQKIEIAVAYCKTDISWLTKEIVNYVKSSRKESSENHVHVDPHIKITILSKCNSEDDIPDFEQDINKEFDYDPAFERIDVQVDAISLVNKGGCDLAYFHYITQYLEKNTAAEANNSILLFLKDSPRTKDSFHQVGRWRSIPEMIYYATQGEFICGIKSACSNSVFHDTGIMKRYTLEGYKRHGDKSLSGEDFNGANYKNLGDFVERELDWRFPNEDLTEVCYGGTFAVPASRLFTEPELGTNMKRFEQILRDGAPMSITEHFAERLWAPFLSNPLNEDDTKRVVKLRETIAAKNGSFMGTLLSPRVGGCERKLIF